MGPSKESWEQLQEMRNADELVIPPRVNPNELRIGNIVLHPPKSRDEWFEINVTAVHILSAANGMFFQPIPLTEERLLKFGFKNTDNEIDYSDFVKSHVSINGCGSDKQEPFSFVLYINYREHKIEIKYVHQLQNLYFALTGEELQLQNPVL